MDLRAGVSNPAPGGPLSCKLPPQLNTKPANQQACLTLCGAAQNGQCMTSKFRESHSKA